MEMDLEVRMEDHLLPWELFCRNVGQSLVNSSSALQQMAIQLVKECHCHLLAIILLARALNNVTDTGVWELALHKLASQSSGLVQGTSQVMKHVLELIWERKDFITKHCINYCTTRWKEGSGKDSLVSEWVSNHLVETESEGKGIFEDLINSFLLENVGKDCFRMRRETMDVLRHFTSYLPSPHIRQGGLGLTETPNVEEWNAIEIELQNNKLSDLPANPKCPYLTRLLLHDNYNLMEIPQLFFEDMPLLKMIDLSHTSIKSLPPSISKSVSLRTLYLRGCELLTELPPQIGALVNLEVLDLEGTEIMFLPKEIGELISLRRFKVSLCGYANLYGETKQMGPTIPTEVLSAFSRLEELSIDVNSDGEWWDAEVDPDGDWWDADVKAILNALSSSKKLRVLKLCLPSVELLGLLRWDSKTLMYPELSLFRFIVGRHQKRIIYRLPHEVEKTIKTWEENKKSLKYINGEGMPTEITEALKHASVFFLDRHWTVKVLSDFGNENMVELECCLLVECNDLQTLINGDSEYPSGVDKEPVFGWLRYLSIHYMKNLQSIWKGPIGEGSLSNLTSLALHTCPNLTTIFTPDMLDNLWWLEELIIEDCPKIKSLVTQEPSNLKSGPFIMPHLARISLLDLPELVTISGRLCIGEEVDSLTVYNCPRLESLYIMEMIPIYKKIKGEKDWWDSLKWHNPKWSRMTHPAYEELRTDEDFMDQLANDIYLNYDGMDNQ